MKIPLSKKYSEHFLESCELVKLCSLKSLKYCVHQQSCRQVKLPSGGLHTPWKYPKLQDKEAASLQASPSCWKEMHRCDFVLTRSILPHFSQAFPAAWFACGHVFNYCLSDAIMWESKSLTTVIVWKEIKRCAFSLHAAPG